MNKRILNKLRKRNQWCRNAKFLYISSPYQDEWRCQCQATKTLCYDFQDCESYHPLDIHHIPRK